jgi:hypothetical protein
MFDGFGGREKGPVGANQEAPGRWLLFGNRPVHDSTMTCRYERGQPLRWSASCSEQFKRDALEFLRSKGLT